MSRTGVCRRRSIVLICVQSRRPSPALSDRLIMIRSKSRLSASSIASAGSPVISTSNGRCSAWRMRHSGIFAGRRRRGRVRRSRCCRRSACAACQPDRLHGGGSKLQFVGHHLQAQQALHPRHQRDLADRLRQEIVGAAFQALHPVLGLIERGDHDDRNVRGARVGSSAPRRPRSRSCPASSRRAGRGRCAPARRMSSASRPFVAVRTSKYSACSRDSSSRTLAGMSSTTRTREVTGLVLTRRRRRTSRSAMKLATEIGLER